jgi:hypothetical protein
MPKSVATPKDNNSTAKPPLISKRRPQMHEQHAGSTISDKERALAVAELIAAYALRTGREPKSVTLSDFRIYGERMWGAQCYRSVAQTIPSLGGFEAIRDTHFCEPLARIDGNKQLWARKDILVVAVGSLGAIIDMDARNKAELLALARVGASRPGMQRRSAGCRQPCRPEMELS